MIRSARSFGFFQLGFLAFMFLAGHWAFESIGVAADTKTSDIDYPLVVINAASMQRLRDIAGLMFESADRNDMSDVVDKWTVDTLKETKGFDRSRPFGMMLYLSTETFLRPLGISYLPVTDLEDALQTLAYGTGTISQVDGKADRHEIHYTENFKLRTLYRNRYLFLVGPDGSDSSLDYNFPDPEKLTSRLSTQYDIAASCLIKSIPVGLKTIALAGVKSQLLAELQQRDDEPESVYRLRRASGEGWVELLDKVINQGEEFTIGGRLDPETKMGRIEIEIAGTTDSKLAKLFQNMAGKRTYFGNLLTNPSTFTMSVSWQLEELQRKLLVTYFEAAQRDLAKKTDQDNSTDLGKIVDPIFKTLMTSADVGHLDAFAQLTGAEEGNFVLTGGVKLATSKKMPDQIAELLAYLKENPNGSELLETLELGAEAIDSYPVHRLAINPPEETGKRMFGDEAQLYIYASPQAIWASFGGETALASLKDSVASTALPQPPQQGRNRVPFQFVTHAQNWLPLSETGNPDAGRFNQRTQTAFKSDNDAMTAEIRPTDRGLRIRFDFESGFLSLMGLNISDGIENGFRGPQGRRGGRRPGQQAPAAAPPQTTN
jgi:hypothetical protein